ncbi:DsrH/TusB family sulfur relay protein [Pseudoalteromonas pernae]|uniref:DsrH/TusB family sulfur relay protein n=1 Tax=Pseudoalteromonas pernae TaxID=3118054 RepID=UPI00324204A0
MSILFTLSQAATSASQIQDKLANEDAILLRGDACYSWQSIKQLPVTVYALQQDMAARGCDGPIDGVNLIDDNQWVELTLQFSTCVSE